MWAGLQGCLTRPLRSDFIVSMSRRSLVSFHRRRSGGFSKRNSDGVAFRKRSKPAAIARVGGLGDDLPTTAQHARNVLIHCLHARHQSLPIVLASPISLIRKRFHFHLRHRGLFPSLSKAMGWSECTQIAPSVLGEQMAKRKQSCATDDSTCEMSPPTRSIFPARSCRSSSQACLWAHGQSLANPFQA